MKVCENLRTCVDIGMKRNEPYVQEDKGLVDLTPWKPAPFVGGALILLVLGIYAVFAI